MYGRSDMSGAAHGKFGTGRPHILPIARLHRGGSQNRQAFFHAISTACLSLGASFMRNPRSMANTKGSMSG